MPYNTRRVSLSLSELGVHVPKRARAVSYPAPPLAHDVDLADLPPNKKIRCVHEFDTTAVRPMNPPKDIPIHIKVPSGPLPKGAENTPPPSPGANEQIKVDTTGIKDEVVVGAIVQLEKTGNRPHTSKELAAALVHTVGTIETSTNPNALIQARLATYLRGPWPIVSPCPIGKQQESVHPRRVFYYLTASPHQPIPDTSAQPPIVVRPQPRIISPAESLQSEEDEREVRFGRERARMSPSPEVDLSSPELDEPENIEHASMYSSRSSLSQEMSVASLAHNSRAVSPPLESEERDFKQTANQLQAQRRDSLLRSRETSEASIKMEDADLKVVIKPKLEDTIETEEVIARRSSEEAVALFGGHETLVVSGPPELAFSSPIIKPLAESRSMNDMIMDAPPAHSKDIPIATTGDFLVVSVEEDDPMDDWTWITHKSPEDMDVEELDNLFDAY